MADAGTWVCGNCRVPSLGGGWPRATPTSALFAAAIPGYNVEGAAGRRER